MANKIVLPIPEVVNELLTTIKAELKNEMFPVGAILMFDANNPGGLSGGASGPWEDNVTLPGWYSCIAGNSAFGCPDLVSKFIIGKAVAGGGASAGSNSVTLAENQLPSHSHGATHNHTGSSGTVSSWHTHTFGTGTVSAGHTHALPRAISNGGTGALVGGQSPDWAFASSGGISANHTHSGTTGNPNLNHSHSVTVDSKTLTTDTTGGGLSFDNRPACYSVIYIRRCI